MNNNQSFLTDTTQDEIIEFTQQLKLKCELMLNMLPKQDQIMELYNYINQQNITDVIRGIWYSKVLVLINQTIQQLEIYPGIDQLYNKPEKQQFSMTYFNSNHQKTIFKELMSQSLGSNQQVQDIQNIDLLEFVQYLLFQLVKLEDMQDNTLTQRSIQESEITVQVKPTYINILKNKVVTQKITQRYYKKLESCQKFIDNYQFNEVIYLFLQKFDEVKLNLDFMLVQSIKDLNDPSLNDLLTEMKICQPLPEFTIQAQYQDKNNMLQQQFDNLTIQYNEIFKELMQLRSQYQTNHSQNQNSSTYLQYSRVLQCETDDITDLQLVNIGIQTSDQCDYYINEQDSISQQQGSYFNTDISFNISNIYIRSLAYIDQIKLEEEQLLDIYEFLYLKPEYIAVNSIDGILQEPEKKYIGITELQLDINKYQQQNLKLQQDIQLLQVNSNEIQKQNDVQMLNLNGLQKQFKTVKASLQKQLLGLKLKIKKSQTMTNNLLFINSQQSTNVLLANATVNEITLTVQRLQLEQQLWQEDYNDALKQLKNKKPLKPLKNTVSNVQVDNQIQTDDMTVHEIINNNRSIQVSYNNIDVENSSKQNHFLDLSSRYDALQSVIKLQKHIIDLEKELTQEKCKSLRFQQQTSLQRHDVFELRSKISTLLGNSSDGGLLLSMQVSKQ
ncbi:hypothetical protein SS50377_26418 [Spironucleus salmonicida]|uniref:Uncharacterized protein n=1 Tax=Spironucleus salmonicida TaxID=348837 RepID=V6LT15_9EUKA|nr:hypothetical protein SS50377_28810 [Spironucleus salmonicida]KAH0572209.1 hypothetical protein SS50377_26418 [Spironucleus salmonicida]|eukprot:EST47715.1 Hypothetical protein SS50377_fx038 [Spironucleus salmonicida]